MEVRGVDEQGDLGLIALGGGVRIAKEDDGEGRACTRSIRPSTWVRKKRKVLPRSVVMAIYM